MLVFVHIASNAQRHHDRCQMSLVGEYHCRVSRIECVEVEDCPWQGGGGVLCCFEQFVMLYVS